MLERLRRFVVLCYILGSKNMRNGTSIRHSIRQETNMKGRDVQKSRRRIQEARKRIHEAEVVVYVSQIERYER
jgi:adenylylsulfate kinase-like enzyme